jgi:Rha family phage regulatory protein
VAETFGRRHDNVLQSIKEAISTTGSFAPDFSGANFIESYYKDRGKFYPEYLLTKDGFVYITMGFSGKKAAMFKVGYIERFNQMEASIKYQTAAKLDHPAFTEAVMLAHPEPKNYHFSNESDMINRIILGVSAKQFKAAHGLPDDTSSIRPYLSASELYAVDALQRADIGMLAVLPVFNDRKAALTALFEKIKNHRLALTA